MADSLVSITEFFRKTLGAPLSNTRWSWGAENPKTRELYLRVWDDERETIEGLPCITLLGKRWRTRSLGMPERIRHVQALQEGSKGIGVVCIAKDKRTDGSRLIASFDRKKLLRLGRLIEENETVYAVISAETPVEVLLDERDSRPSPDSTVGRELADDTEEERVRQRTDIGPTSKLSLINARRGQGIYRENLEKVEQHCRLTGLLDRRHLRASHIKPWRVCTDQEKLDRFNGLLLSPHVDHLFDRGYISFSDQGDLMVCKDLNHLVLEKWGIALPRNVGAFLPTQCQYLEYHRTHVFDKTSGGRRRQTSEDLELVESAEPAVVKPAE